jgi:hypothetical protein
MMVLVEDNLDLVSEVIKSVFGIVVAVVVVI